MDDELEGASWAKPQPISRYKTCPDCAESIKAAAKVCRYCGWGREGVAPPKAKGRAPRRSTSSRVVISQAASSGGTSLVLGILGFFVCGLLGPLAVLEGQRAQRAARAARAPVPGSASAGIVLGWIQIASLLMGVLWVMLAAVKGR